MVHDPGDTWSYDTHGRNKVTWVNLFASWVPSSASEAPIAESILQHKRCEEASDQYCMPIKEILTLIPEDY